MDKGDNIKAIVVLLPIILFLYVSNPVIRVVLAMFYIIYALISGARIKIVPNLTLAITIILINLLSPSGLVLLNVGFINITKDALVTGVDKSALLIGLLYLSKNINSIDIKLPREFGSILKDTFYYLDQLTSGERLTPKGIIGQIDRKLLNLRPYSESQGQANNKKGITPVAPLIVTLILVGLDKLLLNK